MIISASFLYIVTAGGGGRKKVYKEKGLKSGSAFFAMVKKEFSLFLSSATYMLNGGLGLVFTAALGVIFLVKEEYLTTFLAMFAGSDVGFLLTDTSIAAFVTAIFVMLGSMNMISASALSLEGSRFWIVKTMPVSGKTILFAKAMPSLIMTTVATIFGSVCAAIALKADAITTLLVIIVPVTAAVSNSLLGTLLNAAFPRFKFDNETQVIKQSLSVMLTLGASMLVGALCIGSAYLFAVKLEVPLLGMALMLVLNLLIIAVSYIVLAGPFSRKIDRIDV